MKYIGLQQQKSRNNARSLLLLFLFPCLVAGLVYLFFCLLFLFGNNDETATHDVFRQTNEMFVGVIPLVFGVVAIWFLIAYFINTTIINSAAHSKPLDRKENKRVYNLVENLCMSQGMTMPKVNVIEDDSLNAFASGINKKTYTVTLSRGIINKLNDDELEGVIAHELSHIRNNDVRLLIISIVFVGIFSFVAELAFRSLLYGPRRTNKKDSGGSTIVVLLVAVLVAVVGYLCSIMLRFAISKKREYLADAGAAEMTKNPLALASALRKISSDPDIEAVERDDVAQLFIEHRAKQTKSAFSGFSNLFATHPPIKKRIEILEQF